MVWIYHSLFFCELIAGHLGCLQALTAMTVTARNICMQVLISRFFPRGIQALRNASLKIIFWIAFSEEESIGTCIKPWQFF